jgi:Fe2+ or Zn2+ uptake regulation protein
VPRPSPVRDQVLDVLTRAHRLWSIDELLAEVRRTVKSADYSTVFRALGWLEARGRVQRVELGDGRSRYEAASTHHDHIRCQRCGRVEEVPECEVAAAEAEVASSTGFRVVGHSLTFSGLCPDCLGAGAG